MTKNMNEQNAAENQEVKGAAEAELNDQQATQNCEEADNVAEEQAGETDKTTAVADEAAEWKDKYMRLSAEFDNYRKRTLKEKMDLIESGGEDVIKSMLAVMDDFERALAAMQTSTDVASVKEGVELIQHKMCEALKAKGVNRIEAVGQPLDTDLHEAVAKFPAGEDKKGLIIDVVQQGYKLKEKVIRYAKVVVGE